MSQEGGEKTEQPTQRHLEDAVKNGQIAKSGEMQTAFVFCAVLLALTFSARETWAQLVSTMTGILGHLHQVPVTFNLLPSYAITGVLVVIHCVWPVVLAVVMGALLAGCAQNRFQTASDVLRLDWERVNPVAGLQRLFSFRSAMPTALAFFKLAAVMGLSYGEIRSILADPIFYSATDVARIAAFLAESSLKIYMRIALIMVIIAAIDYAYQFWRTHRDLMMTKQEVKEEAKSNEVNPRVRTAQRRRRKAVSQRKMLLEVPRADVVITNPTHLAIALRYDPKSMKAPRVIAKGARLNAQRIREIAEQNHIPIMENKPLARMIFKYVKVDGEIPAQLYGAVAEVLAWVYRINRYRYFAQANQVLN
jgi:flagellar biosynthetic protein FlhB